ncbi:MAG: MCE family protein [Desulfamplus sp.]|nr:MCE family protein [Desulfamplus sp.]
MLTNNYNKVMIGLFVIGSIALVVAAIVVFGSGAFFAEKNVFVLYFRGSVKGLNVGSPVVLRGVKIGVVRDIRINAASIEHGVSIPVLIEISQDCVVMQGDISTKINENISNNVNENISNNVNENNSNNVNENNSNNVNENNSQGSNGDRGRDNGDENIQEIHNIEDTLNFLIKQGLRAQLEMQSLVTGQLLVALDFAPDIPPKFSGLKSEYLEIPTMQSDIEELTQKLKQAPIEDIFNKAFSIISNVDSFLKSESINELLVAMTNALNSINTLSENINKELPDLAVNISETVKAAKHLVNSADTEVIVLSLSLKQAIEDVRKLVSVTLNQVNNIGIGVNETVVETKNLLTGIQKEVHPVSKELQEVFRLAGKTMESAKKASDQANAMLKSFEKIADSDSALFYNLNTTLGEISDAARSVRMLAEYIERHPEAFIQGKQNR